MGFYESALKPALFRLDPESAHELAMKFLRKGILKARPFENPMLRQTLFGSAFRNPLGLAAGFDKNAVALDRWGQMGFGFVEVGTITCQPQEGNPRPRMFRLPQDEALINRLGFNNEGARAAAGRLARAKPTMPVGINMGKTRVVELNDAAKDYAECFSLLHRFGSYFVVNVSSPNTPGLRRLQDPEMLSEILTSLKAVDSTRPILVKVDPDMETKQLDALLRTVHENRAAGIVATNTTLRRTGLLTTCDEEGGLSGKPLRSYALRVLSHLFRSCDPSMVLIGVGGIMNGDDLFDRIAHGAHLCQTYTGWVYGGPSMVPCSLARLVDLMKEQGFSTLDELRGSAIKN